MQSQMIHKDEDSNWKTQNSRTLRAIKNPPVPPPAKTKKNSRHSVWPWVLVMGSLIAFAKFEPRVESDAHRNLEEQIRSVLVKSGDAKQIEISDFEVLKVQWPSLASSTIEYRASLKENSDGSGVSVTELHAEARFENENGNWVLKSQHPLGQRTKFLDGQIVEVK